MQQQQTAAEFARTTKRHLGTYNASICVYDGEGPSLTEAERNTMHVASAEVRDRACLTSLMIPILKERLMPTLPSGYNLVVNCKHYAWTPRGVDAPDLFIAPHYLVEYACAPIEGNECGIFPVFEARKSLVTLAKATVELNDESEGEFIRCLKAFSCPNPSSDDAEPCLFMQGFVFDWERCTLITAIQGCIAQIATVKWTTPGLDPQLL